MTEQVPAAPEIAALIEQGRRHGERHRYRDAIDCLIRACALQPNNAAAHRALGRVYQLAQLWTEAIQPLRNALALLPEDLYVLHELAASLLDADAQEEVAAHLTGLSAAWPSRADIQVLLASTCLDAGDVDSAIGALMRAAFIDPQKFGAWALLRSTPGDFTVGTVDEPAAYCQRVGIAVSRPGDAVDSDGYFVCPLPRARTVGDYFVVATDDDTLLLDGMVYNPEALYDKLLQYGSTELFIARHRYLADFAPAKRIPGTHLLLGGHQNFGHWLMNCFARLAYVASIPALRDVPVVVARDLPPARRELLALAGYGAERLTEIDPSTVAQFDLLWTPIMLCCVKREPRRLVLHSACTRFLNRLARRVIKERPYPLRRYYLTRPITGHRRLANEEALLSALTQFGVESVDPAALSMRDQIKLARSAEVIMSVAGAGLHLTFFAEPGTVVIELTAREMPPNSVPISCRQLGLTLHKVACARADRRTNPLYDDIVAPIDQIIDLLNRYDHQH